MQNTKSILRKSPTGQIVIVGVLTALLIGAVFVDVNAQRDDTNTKYVKELNITLQLNDTDMLLYDAQIYALHMNVSVEEAIRRLRLQAIPVPQNELEIQEAETFAGLWIEHTPEFKYVVLFTRNGEETLKPYLEKYPEFAKLVEVRNNASVSLADLKMTQINISSSLDALGIRTSSEINVRENCVELYVTKSDKCQFEDALQKGKIVLPNYVKVIIVEHPVEYASENRSNILAKDAEEVYWKNYLIAGLVIFGVFLTFLLSKIMLNKTKWKKQ